VTGIWSPKSRIWEKLVPDLDQWVKKALDAGSGTAVYDTGNQGSGIRIGKEAYLSELLPLEYKEGCRCTKCPFT
jgi:hypothetical protein